MRPFDCPIVITRLYEHVLAYFGSRCSILPVEAQWVSRFMRLMFLLTLNIGIPLLHYVDPTVRVNHASHFSYLDHVVHIACGGDIVSICCITTRPSRPHSIHLCCGFIRTASHMLQLNSNFEKFS